MADVIDRRTNRRRSCGDFKMASKGSSIQDVLFEPDHYSREPSNRHADQLDSLAGRDSVSHPIG